MSRSKVETIERRGPYDVVHRQELLGNGFGLVVWQDIWKKNGKKGIWDWIELEPAVLVFPVDSQGKLHVIREFFYPLKQYMYCVPGGSIDQGELPSEAAVREALEETGLSIRPDSLTDLGHFFEIPGRALNQTTLILAEATGRSARTKTDEVIDTVKLPLNVAIEMTLQNKIQIPTVATGLLLIYILMQRSKLPQISQTGSVLTPRGRSITYIEGWRPERRTSGI